MGPDIAIKAEGLGKKYTISHRTRDRSDTLRDTLARGAVRMVRSIGDMARGRDLHAGDELEEFWALRDLDFEIAEGDVVGIIGRNGAGKSTLLKVLSRITQPTTGRLEIRGRMASLLEVGTGFHPELSGRENIFLNGAVLGMTQAEIRRKFDEIVDFAGVERFLDTPVKRYSSGMYVRLAFAVAAHLEPEILVIDEVLAVGDAEFQKKCLGKMNDVASHGRTVLFVSHNLDLINQLCTKGAYLKSGQLMYYGPIQDAVRAYLERRESGSSITFQANPSRPTITGISLDEEALQSGTLDLSMEVQVPEAHRSKRLIGGFILRSMTGTPVWGSNSEIHPDPRAEAQGSGFFRCQVDKLPVIAGEYLVSAWLSGPDDAFDSRIDAMGLFLVHNPQQPRRPPPDVMGYIEFPPLWSFQPSERM